MNIQKLLKEYSFYGRPQPAFFADGISVPMLRSPAARLRLVERLEAVRKLTGSPAIVDAGYRCPKHNREVGGVPNSEHTGGLAAHIRLPGLSLQQMYDLASEVSQFSQGGIGVYDGDFLHVDVRSHRARWARVRGE